MAATDVRQLGVEDLLLGTTTMSPYPDVVSATINTSGSLVSSTTEGDVWAHNFMQMMEMTDTVSISTKSVACFAYANENIGQNMKFSFTIPKAANSSTGSSYSVTIAAGAAAILTNCTGGGATSEESTYTLEFTIASGSGVSSGLSVTAIAV